ncbi:MAG: hypothetical protein U1U88_002165 [Lawsonella clevelandensis]
MTCPPPKFAGRVLTELAAEHEDIVGLSADLAKSTKIGLLGDKFPSASSTLVLLSRT